MPVAVDFIQEDSLFKGHCTNLFMQELACESAGVIRARGVFRGCLIMTSMLREFSWVSKRLMYILDR